MIIPVDENWRLKSDAHCWHIQKCTGRTDKKTGNPVWESQKWLSTLGGALTELLVLKIRLDEAEGFEESMKAMIKHIHYMKKIANGIDEKLKVA